MGCPESELAAGLVGLGMEPAQAVAYAAEHMPEMATDALRTALIASVMLGLLKEWAALDAGAWHPVRHANDKADLLTRTRAAIAQAEAI